MSKPLPWFRAYTEMMDDEKLRLLAFEDRWHFVALLCLKVDGILDANDPLMKRKAAVKMGLSVGELEDVAKRLEKVGLINACTLNPVSGYIAEQESLRPSASAWCVIRKRIFARDDYTCQYCGVRGTKLECDHKHPVARGGSHDDENLVTACRTCNHSKRDKLITEWRPA